MRSPNESPEQKGEPANQQFEQRMDSGHLAYSARVANVLIRAGITSVRRWCLYTAELLLRKTPNLGTQRVAEIEEVLAQPGLPSASSSIAERALYPETEAVVAVDLPPASKALIREVAVDDPPVAKITVTDPPIAESPVVEVLNESPDETALETMNTESPDEASLFAPDLVFRIARTVDPNPLSADILLASLQALLPDIPAVPTPRDETALPTPEVKIVQEGKIDLSTLWSMWLLALDDERQKEILFSYYGVDGDEPLTLEALGEELEMTRERVRQIKSKGLGKLQSRVKRPLQEPLYNLLSTAVAGADLVLTVDEWRQALDEGTIWNGDEARPSLLRLLCELFDEFGYNNRYHVVCPKAISEHLEEYHKLLKRILFKHKRGLAQEAMLEEIGRQRSKEMPIQMEGAAFLIKALSLFDHLREMEGRYYHVRAKKPSLFPGTEGVWLGKAGTQMYAEEQKLRQQIEKVNWIGQLAISEAEFQHLCQIIGEEAQGRNYFTKAKEGQPRQVPAALFITTMVFAARYSQQGADEFWPPYLQSVWHVEYNQSFMVRCRKRFNAAVAELEENCMLEFPRFSDGDVVAPVYRHALLPRYVQKDFAEWMYKKWREILALADSPPLLIAKLQQDSTLEHLSRRLQSFVLSKETKETAASLIVDMAAAISLYVNRGESIADIREQLAETPIEQELWDEIAQAITQEFIQERAQRKSRERNGPSQPKSADASDRATAEPSQPEIEAAINAAAGKLFDQEPAHEIALEKDTASVEPLSGIPPVLRLSPPRIAWLWDIEEGALVLRVQNIILLPEDNWEGEADRLVWVTSPEEEPTRAAIEVEVQPLYMETGEQVVQEALITQIGDKIDECGAGEILLLTDMDEVVACLTVPPLPSRTPQFFRPIQQGAYALPVDAVEVGSGVWLLCAGEELTLRDEEGEPIEADGNFPIPYPLHNRYDWAAQFSLTLPVTVEKGGKPILELAAQHNQAPFAPPLLQGTDAIGGLSPHLPPLFSSVHIALTVADGGERLAKQGSLWLFGEDGFRCIRPLAEMISLGGASLDNDALWVDLSRLLPVMPNSYALELRAGLRPLLAEALHFSVLPGVGVAYPADAPLYTPATPFQILLSGVEQDLIAPESSVSIATVVEGAVPASALRITWKDLRADPQLLLRFGKSKIRLLWSVARFMAWLEPAPANAFLTLDELRQTTLHAVGKGLGNQANESKTKATEGFFLAIKDQERRAFALKRSQLATPFAQSQFFEMIRLTQSSHLQVEIGVGKLAWPFFEVRQRPNLAALAVTVDEYAPVLHVKTGLQKAWVGEAHFYALSLTNPFAPAVGLGDFERLSAQLDLSLAALADDTYRLGLDLDGAPLPLDEQVTTFTVGREAEQQPEDPELGKLIRSGELIPEDYANDFILWWAEIAEAGQTEITRSTRYQLVTIDARALEFFDYPHLKKLWPPLADLRAVREQRRWRKDHGPLPVWVLQPAKARYPAAVSYLQEPNQRFDKATLATTRWRQLATLTNTLLWQSSRSEATSPWSGAARLITHWKVREVKCSVFALAVFLRTAAYYPNRYDRLLKEAALFETDIEELLTLMNLYYVDHLRWGLTWAELLFVHSLRHAVR